MASNLRKLVFAVYDLERAVGRSRDFSGTDFSDRDLGWVCNSPEEAARVAKAIENLGLVAQVV